MRHGQLPNVSSRTYHKELCHHLHTLQPRPCGTPGHRLAPPSQWPTADGHMPCGRRAHEPRPQGTRPPAAGHEHHALFAMEQGSKTPAHAVDRPSRYMLIALRAMPSPYPTHAWAPHHATKQTIKNLRHLREKLAIFSLVDGADFAGVGPSILPTSRHSSVFLGPLHTLHSPFGKGPKALLYISGMPSSSHSRHISSGQMLAWISPIWALCSISMQRRL